jgi:hypothetical protein
MYDVKVPVHCSTKGRKRTFGSLALKRSSIGGGRLKQAAAGCDKCITDSLTNGERAHSLFEISPASDNFKPNK